MRKTILQVPVSKDLKEKAEQAATKQGFSSLQESIRVFLTELSQGNLKISFEPVVKLSSKAESRYLKQTLDFEKNKNIISAKSAEELMAKLNANKGSLKVR